MDPKDAEGIANSVDPDKTAPEQSGSVLFAQTCLSQNLGALLWFENWIELTNMMTHIPVFT